jgi:hypothetical protein
MLTETNQIKFSQKDLERLPTLIEENSSLRGFIQGYLAESVLKERILLIEGVSSVTKIPDQDDKKGDLLIIYKDTPITLESKSLQSRTIKYREDGHWDALVKVEASDSRELYFEDGSKLRTAALLRDQFDILTISCYAIDNTWSFLYMLSNNLPKPKIGKIYTSHQVEKLVKPRFRVNPIYTPGIKTNLESLLEQVYVSKSQI